MTATQVQGSAIALRAVGRVFDPNVVAIDRVDLDVAHGEFVALLGPSGCGKSTLLRLIAGLDHPTQGTVDLQDHKARGQQSPGSIAYVFQEPHLMPWRSVLGNVVLPLELRGVDHGPRLAAARDAVEQVGLTDAVARYPAQLSGGMKMRASLARALVTDPRLLLLDEPFAALDEITRHRLDEQLNDLWLRRGMTVLFVTHSIAEAVFLAQRVVVMSPRPGRIVGERTIDLPARRTREHRTGPAFMDAARELSRMLHGAGGNVR